MDDKQLEKLQEELLAQVNAPLELEQYIKDISDKVAFELYASKKVLIEFEDTQYLFKSRSVFLNEKKGINIVVADMVKFKLLREKYIPYQVTVEIDNNFSEVENLRAAVEAFFRHVTNLVQPEEIN
ncbi:hypothetical protein ACTQX2_02475 [Megamonas funiformis]|uniref:hypothetical protein n=1 Tax=Megamonas funiformis TaxID=437897 RepID=UPI003F9CCEED